MFYTTRELIWFSWSIIRFRCTIGVIRNATHVLFARLVIILVIITATLNKSKRWFRHLNCMVDVTYALIWFSFIIRSFRYNINEIGSTTRCGFDRLLLFMVVIIATLKNTKQWFRSLNFMVDATRALIWRSRSIRRFRCTICVIGNNNFVGFSRLVLFLAAIIATMKKYRKLFRRLNLSFICTQ